MKIKLKISGTAILIFKFCLILLGICAIGFIIYLLHEQYIVFKTEQTYNILRDAYNKTIKTTNFEWEEGKMNSDVLSEAFVKNLPVKKDCKHSNDETCFVRNIRFTPEAIVLKRGDSLDISVLPKALLKNGAGVSIMNISPTCNTTRNRCGVVFVDVNGPKKGPNMLSRDIFDFIIFKDKVEVYDIEGNHFPNCVYGGGFTCSSYLLQFRNRNYKSYEGYVKRHNLKDVNMDRHPPSDDEE